ncbi:MAG: BREX system P-loop protein BrxC, partial [Solirubrobacterales bacterium]
ALNSDVAADSRLAAVKEALAQLEAAQKVRLGDDGYRIPTPAEDDWEQLRSGMNPKPGDAQRIYSEALESFWQPQPSHMLAETKAFKAGLAIHGRGVVDGDMMFYVYLADDGKGFEDVAAELRSRSQQERQSVFWAVSLNDAIDRETVELFRSKEALARKEREAKTADETALISEERVRLRRHQDELRRLLKAACLGGSVYFRGNDRSPGDRAVDVGKSGAEILGNVLPEVFDRFKEAAARSTDLKKGLDALLTAENLQGLPSVFGTLGLLRDEQGKTVFRVESGPLAEVISRVEERANYGETTTGRFLADEFAKEPFGWDFEAVRLLVLSLLRAGKIQATSKGQTIDAATGIEARDTFSNNNLFRQASFRPKKGIEFAELVKASDAFRDTFGSDVGELNAGVIVAEVRKEIVQHEDTVVLANGQLTAHRLPGGGVLEGALGQMKAILRGSEDDTIATFNASHRSIKDAIKRAAELEQSLSEPRLRDLERARMALGKAWPFLREEANIAEDLSAKAATLEDLLARETFYKELPLIEQHAAAIETEYERRYDEAFSARIAAYTEAFDQLVQTPEWSSVEEDQQRTVAAPIRRGMAADKEKVPIPQLRSDRDACEGRLRAAVAELRRLIDGERLATVILSSYFGGGVETEEQLDQVLDGIREECARLIGAGKKVIVQ